MIKHAKTSVYRTVISPLRKFHVTTLWPEMNPYITNNTNQYLPLHDSSESQLHIPALQRAQRPPGGLKFFEGTSPLPLLLLRAMCSSQRYRRACGWWLPFLVRPGQLQNHQKSPRNHSFMGDFHIKSARVDNMSSKEIPCFVDVTLKAFWRVAAKAYAKMALWESGVLPFENFLIDSLIKNWWWNLIDVKTTKPVSLDGCTSVDFATMFKFVKPTVWQGKLWFLIEKTANDVSSPQFSVEIYILQRCWTHHLGYRHCCSRCFLGTVVCAYRAPKAALRFSNGEWFMVIMLKNGWECLIRFTYGWWMLTGWCSGMVGNSWSSMLCRWIHQEWLVHQWLVHHWWLAIYSFSL